jgi:hypothetical protein
MRSPGQQLGNMKMEDTMINRTACYAAGSCPSLAYQR